MQVAACAAGTLRNKVSQLCDTCEAGKYLDGNVADLPFCLQCPVGISSVRTAACSIGVF